MSSSTGGGGLGLGLVNIPASFRNIPNSNEWILERLEIGSTIKRDFQVINSTNKPMLVVLYPGAATNANGTFFGAPMGVKNDLVSWMTVSPSSVLIPAHQGINGLITITVPISAEPSMQYGLVWAQTTLGINGGVTQINRVGIRMYDPVGDFAVPTYIDKALPSSPANAGEIIPRATDGPTTGFVVTRGQTHSISDFLIGLDWILVGIVVAIISGVIYKKIIAKYFTNGKF